MAKKYSARKLILKNNLNNYVDYLYQNGFLHSIIWHSTVLIFLALTFPCVEEKPKPIVLDLCFSQHEEVIDDTPIAINLDFSQQEPKDSDTNNTDEQNCVSADLPDIGSENENTENITINSLDIVSDDTRPVEELSINLVNKEIFSKKITTRNRIKTNSKQKSNGQQTISESKGNNGVDDIQARLKEYGAKTGDIQISLSWDTTDDLDLHVVVNPIKSNQSNINWRHKIGSCGGVLDIDMNAHPRMLTNRPIENIFWSFGSAPHGEYIIGVHFYMNWSGNLETNAKLLIKINETKKTIPLKVKYPGVVIPITTINFPQ